MSTRGEISGVKAAVSLGTASQLWAITLDPQGQAVLLTTHSNLLTGSMF